MKNSGSRWGLRRPNDPARPSYNGLMNRTFLISILALALLIGCKKESKEITYYTTYVNTAMLTKYFFKPGTYWVYEDQSNFNDSVIVTGGTNGFTTIPCPHGCPGGVITRYEYYEMNLFDFTNNITSNHYYMSNYIKLNGGGEYGQLGQPIFMYDRAVNYSFNGAKVIDKYDSMTVSGIKYYNITKMKITASLQFQKEFLFDTYLYFADNFGIIKKEINDTINGYQTWNLKRSHIVK